MDAIIQQRRDEALGVSAPTWKVGELAERTGLSVRALHYYEEIGLLSPSRRTWAGHRLYAADDVLRPQRIVSLRHLGFTLEETRACLDGPDFPARRIVELHAARIRERMRSQRRLLGRLEALASRLDPAEEEVPAGEFVQTVMEVIAMSERVERYYTPEQLETLERRGREIGDERIREVEAEWPRLMQDVHAEMEAGADPSDERVQRLAKRWMELVGEFTGGDPGIERSLGNMWRQEENIHDIDTAETRELGEYVSRALAASDERG